MCIAVPMRVIAMSGPHAAVCETLAGPVIVDVALLERIGEGDWLLAHAGVALRTLEPDEARLIADALAAAALAEAGQPFEHLFADLIGREPQLPEHLR